MAIRNNFVTKNFTMNSIKSCVFHHSQWDPCTDEEHVSVPYLIYRFLFMMILISSLIFSTLCQSYLFPIFLTNWSFTLQTLYGILFAFNILWKKGDYLLHLAQLKLHNNASPDSSDTTKTYELNETNSWDKVTDEVATAGGDDGDEKDMSCVNFVDETSNSGDHSISSVTVLTTDSSMRKPATANVAIINSTNNNNNSANQSDVPNILEKVIWILMNVTHVLPHVVAFGYWVFVYKYDPDQASCERFRSHFIVHGATSVLAFVDAMIVAVPARATHFVFPTFTLFMYILFSFIYEVAGGPYRSGKEFIYAILNWRHKPGRTILLMCGGVIVSPIVHVIMCWGVHHLRLRLVAFYNTRRRNK